MSTTILVTGACGYLGRRLTEALAETMRPDETILAADVVAPQVPIGGVEHVRCDVRDAALRA